MPVKKTAIMKFNSKAKKWACVGGAVIVAGAGAWGLTGLQKDTADNTIITQQPGVNQATTVLSGAQDEQPQKSVNTEPFALKTHVVKTGDTLTAIAAEYNIDVDTILGANPQTDELIYPGDELKILPAKGVYYQVRAGDNLWRIGQNYNVTVETIVKENKKPDDQIVIGENLFIPGARYSRVEKSEETRAQPVVSRSISGRLIWPVGGEFSSPFGWRWGRFHSGVDIANEIGAPVVAAGPGQIIWAGSKGGYGYAVMIKHNNDYVTLYGHLDDYFVEKGQYVRAGQRIASVGNTGNSTGPHLHFEVLKNGEHIDPMELLP